MHEVGENNDRVKIEIKRKRVFDWSVMRTTFGKVLAT